MSTAPKTYSKGDIETIAVACELLGAITTREPAGIGRAVLLWCGATGGDHHALEACIRGQEPIMESWDGVTSDEYHPD